MFKKTHIKQHERGLLFREGDFVRPLGPGTHRIPIWRLAKDRIQVVDTLKTKFEGVCSYHCFQLCGRWSE